MENIQIGLDELIGGGIVAAIISGVFAMAHILLNKKVRTPADSLAGTSAAIEERNQILAQYRLDLEGARADIGKLQTGMDDLRKKLEEQDQEIDLLKSEALANEHYIYRCIGTIYRLGTAEDIPKPPPTRIKLTHTAGDHHG